jgi:pimeloyl-ACP methyl ester carboxylesterase
MKNFKWIGMAIALVLYASCSSIPVKTIEEKYTNSESKFIEVDNMRVHYRDEGTGPVVVLLHGMLSSLHTWDGWTEVLKANYRVVRLDIPGFGLTGPAPKGYIYSGRNVVKSLNTIFDKMGLTKFSLAGSSLGGYFAWEYSLVYPARVENLILIDPAGYPQEVPGPIKLLTAPVIGPLATVITPKFLISHYLKQVYGDPSKMSQDTTDRYYNILMREGNRQSSKEILTVMKANSNNPNVTRYIAKLNTMSVPVLVMWGDKDIWVPTSILENWKADLPRAEYVVFKGAGHVPMEEIPVETVTAAIKFMSGKLAADMPGK